MSSGLQKTAVWLLALLGAGLIGFLYWSIRPGASAAEAGGWIAAGLLSLREVFSKIEKIVVGHSTDLAEAEDDAPLDLTGSELERDSP